MNGSTKSRAKHIDTKYHFIREAIANGHVELIFFPSESMIADAFTKQVPRDRFELLRFQMGLRPEINCFLNCLYQSILQVGVLKYAQHFAFCFQCLTMVFTFYC